MQFFDWLQTATQQQIDSPEAADLLGFQLVIENANADCKRAIAPLQNQVKTVADLIKACQNVGSEQHKAELLAAALTQQLTVAKAAEECFLCGQEGRIKKDCPHQNGRGRSLRGGAQGRAPTQLCPRCQEGYHWGNQRRSKFDKFGNTLPGLGNSRRGTRSGALRATNRATWQSPKPPACLASLRDTTSQWNAIWDHHHAPAEVPGWTWLQASVQQS